MDVWNNLENTFSDTDWLPQRTDQCYLSGQNLKEFHDGPGTLTDHHSYVSVRLLESPLYITSIALIKQPRQQDLIQAFITGPFQTLQ